MAPADPVRVAVVPPVPVPYREPLFARLAARPALRLRVIYQAGGQSGWDQPAEWFPGAEEHAYDAQRLAGSHTNRTGGRTPITWPRGLGAALAAFDPRVVVVSEFGPATLRALAWCRRRRRPLLVLTEVTSAVEAMLPRPQREAQRALARAVDGFVAVSGAARERLLALGVAPDSIAVSLQPADEDALLAAVAPEPARASGPDPSATSEQAATADPSAASGRTAARPASAPVEVLTVARLVADKDVGLLVEAFARAGLARAEATLTIAGDGPLAGELRAQAARHGVEARLLGPVRPAELPALYARADAFALASRYEPFGVAVREAAIAGLPIVCSRAVGAAPDFALEGRNALLFDPGSAEQLADALARVCREPELRARMAAASREVAAEHPLERDVDAFEQAVLRAASKA